MAINTFLINYNNNVEVFFDKGILLYISNYNSSPYIISNFSTISEFKLLQNSLNDFTLSLINNSTPQSIVSDFYNSIKINSIEVLFNNYPSLVCDTAIFLYIDETSDSISTIPCNSKLTSSDLNKFSDKLSDILEKSLYKEKLIG